MTGFSKLVGSFVLWVVEWPIWRARRRSWLILEDDGGGRPGEFVVLLLFEALCGELGLLAKSPLKAFAAAALKLIVVERVSER